MTTTEQASSARSVKGSVIIDYLKIIRANPDLPWSDHLLPGDLEQLGQMILPASWYPVDLFQRMGQAIFKLVSKENYQVVRSFGRALADRLNAENPSLVVPGKGLDTVKKYLAIQGRLYSFEVFKLGELDPGRMVIHIQTSPEDKEDRLLVEAVSGTILRLIELAGGKNAEIKILKASWKGDDRISLEIAWEGQKD